MAQSAAGMLVGSTPEARKDSLNRLVNTLRWAPAHMTDSDPMYEPSDGEADPAFEFLAELSDVSYDGYDELWDDEGQR